MGTIIQHLTQIRTLRHGTKHHSLDLKLQRPCLDPTEPCSSSDDLVTGAKALELRRLALEKGFGFIAVTITAPPLNGF